MLGLWIGAARWRHVAKGSLGAIDAVGSDGTAHAGSASALLIRVVRAAVARAELILGIGSTSVGLVDRQLRLVGVVVLPLATLLILDHLLHFKSRRLRQMALRI